MELSLSIPVAAQLHVLLEQKLTVNGVLGAIAFRVKDQDIEAGLQQKHALQQVAAQLLLLLLAQTMNLQVAAQLELLAQLDLRHTALGLIGELVDKANRQDIEPGLL
jgi:hypothetical protein